MLCRAGCKKYRCCLPAHQADNSGEKRDLCIDTERIEESGKAAFSLFLNQPYRFSN